MPKQKTVKITKEERLKYRSTLKSLGDGKIGRELFWHIKSRYRILYVRGSEENRIINAFKLIAKSEGYELYQWDCSRGMLNAFSKKQIAGKTNDIHESAEAALHHIVEQAKADNESMAESATVPTGGHIYMLLDFHHELDSPTIERLFKEFASFSSISHIVIVSPTFVCPIALDKEFTLIDFPPPSRAEVKLSLDKMIKQIPVKFPKALKAARDNMENILHATTGLTISESENAYAKALIKTKNFDIPSIIEEKEQIIRRGGILECRSPRYTFDQVGGLGELKDWLELRRLAFEDSARDFGLDAPKGVLLVGIPGTGKSLSADALASLWSFPLIRLDMGALFSAHVGESEENTRIAIQTAESIAPCIFGNTNIVVNGEGNTIEDIFNKQVNSLSEGGLSPNVDDTFENAVSEKQVWKKFPDRPNQTIVHFDWDKAVKIQGVADNTPADVRLLAVIRTKVKDKLIKIRTKSGREIITTKNHLLMDGGKNMKKAEDFCPGGSISIVDNNSI